MRQTVITATVGLLLLIATGDRVAAVSYADSVASNGNSFSVATLQTPTGLAATGGASISLNWTATASTWASGYRVLRSATAGGPYSQVAQVTPQSSTSHQDTGLTPGATYYYVLRSYYQNWESGNSNEASAAADQSACTAGDTGFRSPTAEAADTGGDGDGFEVDPTSAFADDAAFASNIDGGGDVHRYFNYGLTIPTGCLIKGIEVQLDWWLDSVGGNNTLDVQLSWDSGTSWTAAKSDTVESTTEHTTILGGAVDTWGRSWAVADLDDANFRVRLVSTGPPPRDFFLDWAAVRVSYAAP